MNKQQINSVIGILVIAIMFIVSSYLTQAYFDDVSFMFQNRNVGMSLYVLLSILSIVLAPVSVMPLMPLASRLWGWPLAGVLSIIGWTIGAVIAFLLARHYGVPLVSKLLPMKTIYKFEKKIPQEHLFWSVVLFRMVIPVDGLSYVLGLFTKMSVSSYTLATIIGITPFAFFFAYAGTIDFFYQMILLSVVLFISLIVLLIIYFKHEKLEKEN